jgi:hypothetical protein
MMIGQSPQWDSYYDLCGTTDGLVVAMLYKMCDNKLFSVVQMSRMISFYLLVLHFY